MELVFIEPKYIFYIVIAVCATAYTWHKRNSNRKNQESLKDHILSQHQGLSVERIVFSHNGETAFFIFNNSFYVIRAVDAEFDEDRYSVNELLRAEIHVDNLRTGELVSDFDIDHIRSMWKKNRSSFIGDSDDSCAIVVKFFVKEQPRLGLNQLEILDTDSVGKGRLNLDNGLRNLNRMKAMIDKAVNKDQNQMDGSIEPPI